MAGAAESIRLAVENPGCDGMIVAPNYNLLQRVTLRMFLRLLPRKLLSQHRKSLRCIELVNGSRVWYASADRPETLEGSNLSWLWLDEGRYAKREAWEVMLARVRAPEAQRLSIIITSTPSMGWLYDEFGREERDNWQDFVVPTATNHYLPDTYLESLRRSYSAELYQQYVEGAWVQLTGGVFPQFADHHLQDLEVVEHVPVDVALDPGITRSAVLFFQHLKWCPHHHVSHCIHVLDELMPDNTPTAFLAPTLREMYSKNPHWTPGACYIDPAGNNRSIETGISSVEILEHAGFSTAYTTDPTKRSIPNGIALIQSKLKPVKGKPSLYIHQKLQGSERGIVRALRESVFPDPGRGRRDEPIKDGLIDHARDTLRYAMINTCDMPGSSFAGAYQ